MSARPVPETPASSPTTPIELLLDWIGALRAADLDAVAGLLAPDVVWQGLTGELHCSGRGEVLVAIAEQLPLRLRVDALELVALPGHLVLGARSAQLPEPAGVKLDGKIYNVFKHDGRRILSIRDFAARGDALDSTSDR